MAKSTSNEGAGETISPPVGPETAAGETAPAAGPNDGPPPTAKEKKAREKEEAKKKAAPAETEPMPGLIEGRIVHYVLPDGKRRGEHRAAIVSRVIDPIAGRVSLQAFLNGAHDYAEHDHPGNLCFIEDVPFSAVPQAEGHWHWMERA